MIDLDHLRVALATATDALEEVAGQLPVPPPA